MMKKIVWAAMVVTVISTACSRTKNGSTDPDNFSNAVVLEWNEIAYKAFGGPAYQHSLMAARINAMTQLAMHDAVNAVHPQYATYQFAGKDALADPVAAAASAAYTVLLQELPEKKSFLDSSLSKTLAALTDGEAKARGIALGELAAAAILEHRSNDGATGDVAGQVPPSTVPGVYQTVPPFNIVFAPFWENLRLFSLERKDQFRSAPHPSINSTAYVNAFNEVKEIGKLNSTTRSADASAYAKFWYEFSEAGWNRVARTVAAQRKLNLFETARLLALVDMAIADAYTAGWDSKFHYNFWRPYTAIRMAATDGNEATQADPQWEPAEPTPPVQDYPSTHSALGNAAATVLARILGDNTPFSMTSPTAVPAGYSRSFQRFSQAADENADSRVQAGIHFRFSCLAGQEMGNKIGNWTFENHLKPLNQ